MSEVTPVTIRYIHPPHHGHTSQYHGHEWMTHIILFIVNWPPHSWDKAILDSDLETPRSRSWVWSKGKVIQSAQHHINSLPVHFTSIRPKNSGDGAISKFDLETSKVKVMSEVKGQGHIVLYPVSNQCTSFLFHINRTNHSWDMAKNNVWPWKNTSESLKENLPK